MKILEQFPLPLVQGQYDDLCKMRDEQSKHITLLKIAEDILQRWLGLYMGIYRTQDIQERLEQVLFHYSTKALSFGDLLSMLRKFSQSVRLDDLELLSTDKLDSCGVLVGNFERLLQGVIHQGIDCDFQHHINNLGSINRKANILDAFEVLIRIRNIHAHPSGKAKNPLRIFPLHEEYFGFINPYIDSFLSEFIITWRSMPIEILRCRVDSIGCILINENNEKILQDKNINQNMLIHNHWYARLSFSKIYPIFSEIPEIDFDRREQIVQKNQQERGLKYLEKVIRRYLNQGGINAFQLFRIKDDARTYYLSEDTINQLIQKIQLQYSDAEHDITNQISSNYLYLNPFWFIHFSHLSSTVVESGDRGLETPTGRHVFVWKDLHRFMDGLVQQYMTDAYYAWTHAPNKYQQGRLAGHYWSRMVPEKSKLGTVFNIGLFLRKPTRSDSRWMKKVTKKTDTQMFIWLNPDTKRLTEHPQKDIICHAFKQIVLELMVEHRLTIPGVSQYVLLWNITTDKQRIVLIEELSIERIDDQEILCPFSLFVTLEDVIHRQTESFEQLVYFAQFLKNVLYRLNDLLYLSETVIERH